MGRETCVGATAERCNELRDCHQGLTLRECVNMIDLAIGVTDRKRSELAGKDPPGTLTPSPRDSAHAPDRAHAPDCARAVETTTSTRRPRTKRDDPPHFVEPTCDYVDSVRVRAAVHRIARTVGAVGDNHTSGESVNSSKR